MGVIISVGKTAVFSTGSVRSGRVVNEAKWKLDTAPPIVRAAVLGLFVRSRDLAVFSG